MTKDQAQLLSGITLSPRFWNMRTNSFDEEVTLANVGDQPPERLRDFIPQNTVALFDALIAQGTAPLDALADVLETATR